MAIHVKTLWTSLHWATRIAMLLVLFAIQWWQARYTWISHDRTYGWPIAFANAWDAGESYPWLLALDAAVWLVLLASVGYALERLWRKTKPFQFSLGSLFGLQAVVAVLLALGGAERFLRANPSYGWMALDYASSDWGRSGIWFDIELLTDSPLHWPLSRIAIILAIGCVVYTAGSLVSRVVWCREAATLRHSPTFKEPAIARFLQRPLAVIDVLLSLWLLFPLFMPRIC